ncbi:MAG: DUF481 domain-containing protein [Alphaproteobacteria bacterium]
MIKIHFYLFVFFMLFSVQNLFAQEISKDPVWHASVSGAFESKNGNSKQKEIDVETEIERTHQAWLSRLVVEALNTKERDTRIEERYEAGLRTQYNLHEGYREGTYFYTDLDYLRDHFGWYDYAGSVVLGVGYSLLKEEKMQFDAELGAGGIRSRFADGIHDNGGIAVLGTRFRWDITEEMDFEQISELKTTEEVQIIDIKTSLQTHLIKDIYLKLKHEIKRISHVPLDRKKTDTVTTLNLAYAF